MPRKTALLIGSRIFEDPSLARLSAPWDDVEKLGNVLQENGGFEVDKYADLGLDDIREAIQRHFQAAERDDTVLLYYTGHGLRDTNGHDLYLALRRTKTDVLRSTSLDAAFIRREMQLSRSQRQILIFDCCHSGAFMGGADIAKKGAQTLTESDVLEPGGTGQYVLAASAANESAFERDGASIYTEFMVEALRTGAAAPEKEDVTVDDLHDYLVRRVGADEAPMRPHIWKAAANRPLVLARNPDVRKPLPPELIEGLFDRDVLRAQGAVSNLLRLKDGHDNRLAKDAEKALRDRLRKTDDLLAVVADGIREGLDPPSTPVAPSRPQRPYLPWIFAALGLGLAGYSALALRAELQAQATGPGALRAEIEDLSDQLAEQELQLSEATVEATQSKEVADDLRAERDELRGMVEELQSGNDTLTTRLSELEAQAAAQQTAARLAGQKLEDLETERDELTTSFEALTKELETERGQAAALREQTEDLQEELTALREEEKPLGGDESLASQAPLSTFKDCTACPEMVVIPGGTFTMGSPGDEEPRTDVTVTSFALARTEVTFDQWRACVDGGGCRSNARPDDEGWGEGDRPVINVSWEDAQEYIDWLNGQAEGDPYRLPSEAEWEYAARATTVSGVPGRAIFTGNTTTVRASEWSYPWGEKASRAHANFGAVACCSGHAEGPDEWINTAPVGSFEPNGFGLSDMHGNVWEWVEDCWHVNYQGRPTDSSSWLEGDEGDCSRRVVRGGSWFNVPRYLRSAVRDGVEPDIRGDVIGFRPARTLLPLSP